MSRDVLRGDHLKQPTVTAICLTADRQAYTDRAVQCFLSQTYENSSLLIYDTGAKPYTLNRLDPFGRIILARPEILPVNATIGQLRNEAHALITDSEVLIHFDSDDWSAPYRIQESVSLLVNSNADIVGYNELLFWESVKGEAWQYRHPDHKYPIGASLCYWRKYWAENPFKETSAGEDFHFVHCQRTSAMGSLQSFGDDPSRLDAWRPMLVAEIHGGNACSRITPDNLEWKRQSGWDARLRTLMAI